MAAASNFPDAIKRTGLSQVHTPPDAGLVDIVFIHGLNGHPYDTWTSDTSKTFWPGQLLPTAVDEEQARVLVYGYDTDVASLVDGVSKNKIHIHAEQLVAELCANRRIQKAAERPLIFVAHSLGGLVVKRALIYSSEIHSEKSEHLRSIFVSTYGLLFLGTPHGGSNIAEWDTRLESICKATLPAGSISSQPQLVSAFRTNSETIQNIDRSFIQLASRFRIYFFHEGKPTNLKGNYRYIVNEESAAPNIQDVERACIQQDHSHMCKFENDSAPGFHIVTEAISRYASQASETIISRWNTDKAEQRKRREARVEELLPELSTAVTNSSPASSMSLPLDSSQARKPLFLIPYGRDRSFVDRKDIFTSINKQMMSNRRVALSGIGGIGKSQIAIEYCYRFRDKHPHTQVFWVHASTKQRFDQAYRDIARGLRLPGWNDLKKDTLRLVCEWCNGTDDESWLMVLDNVDDLEMFFARSNGIIDYLPQNSRGFMLITSRDERVAKRLAGIHAWTVVNPMSAAEAQALLESRQSRPLNSLDRDKVRDLLEALGYFPLAIAQAAAFIDENHTSVSQYLESLGMSDSELDVLSEDLGDIRRDSQGHNSIIMTWKISFDLISKRNPRAAEILSLMAVLDRHGIAESLIKDASDRTIDFQKAIGTLLAFSLIKSENNGAGYGLHRLVQLATQKWLEIQNTMGKWQEKALLIVANTFPQGSFDNLAKCEILLPHAQKVLQYEYADETSPKEYSRLLFNIARLDRQQGRYQKAYSKYLAVIAVEKKLFGTDHPSTLLSMAELGITLCELGRYDEGEKLLIQVVEDTQRVLGAEHLYTLRSMHYLATAYRRQHRWEEAETLQSEVLEATKRTQGREHNATLATMNDLALTYTQQGRWREAEELQLQVLDGYKRSIGAEHPIALSSMYNLAYLYQSQRQLEKAETLFTRVNEARERVLGAEHPETLASVHSLGSTYILQGRWEEAETLLTIVLETRKRVLGSEHPRTLLVMANMAVVLSEQDRHSEAIKMMESVLESRKKVLGPDHKETISAAVSLKMWSST